MSLLRTPPSKKPDDTTPPSPSTRQNGVDISKKYVSRTAVLQQTYEAALQNRQVVLRSPASTGKSSVLMILAKELREKQCTVATIVLNDSWETPALLDSINEDFGISFRNNDALRSLKNTWLLIDDAQNIYAKKYDGFWQAVIKNLDISGATGLFVVIATTYDLSTPKSSVTFHDLPHIDPSFEEKEAIELIRNHFEYWGYHSWTQLSATILKLSHLQDRNKYHAGVIMAAVRSIDTWKKSPGMVITEETVVEKLRDIYFAKSMDLFFYVGDARTVVTTEVKNYLVHLLLTNEERNAEMDLATTIVAPMYRAGMLNRFGRFSCLAANWYYNRYCFPMRAVTAPTTLRELILKTVMSMSATRLRHSQQDGNFPKEAAFSIFSMRAYRCICHHRKSSSQYNTMAYDSDDPEARPVTGELDFYVKSKHWGIELLKEGKGIGEHLGRFNNGTGKYRKVITKDYYVVDCRGPKHDGKGASLIDHGCTLYFSHDFTTCQCEIKGEDTVDIHLQC